MTDFACRTTDRAGVETTTGAADLFSAVTAAGDAMDTAGPMVVAVLAREGDGWRVAAELRNTFGAWL